MPRVAVELDGGQHLGDPAAYRRDRRKDQLLQENGYLVLRFLAEDVGKELDMVLDAILRAIGQRAPLAVSALHFVRGTRQ
jgi:very-short-patch-repair endonuclease